MRKFFLLTTAVTAIVLSGCNKENVVPAESTNGMTLSVNVEKTAETRAQINNWVFSFEDDIDQLQVTSSFNSCATYYTFTRESGKFISATAPQEEGIWYAFFPGTSIDLTNQQNRTGNVANSFCYCGKNSELMGGDGNISMTLYPASALIEIINMKGSIDINALDPTNNNYITGMTSSISFLDSDYTTGTPKFNVVTSTSKASLYTTTTTGTYCIAVPAGNVVLYDGTTKLVEANLTAGNHYKLTITSSGKGTGNIYSYHEKENTVTYDDGAKLRVSEDSSKNWGEGAEITVGGISYVAMVASKAGLGQYTAPSGKYVASVIFYAIQHTSSGTPVGVAYLSQFNGATCSHTVESTDGENPDVIVKSFGIEPVESFTFKFTENQADLVMAVGLVDTKPSVSTYGGDVSSGISTYSVTYSDGATLTMDTAKKFTSGNDMTAGYNKYASIKNSKGKQCTFTAPTNKYIKSVTFYVTNNDESSPATLTQLTDNDGINEIVTTFKNYSNPDVITRDFTSANLSSFSFTFSSIQVAFVMKVVYSD